MYGSTIMVSGSIDLKATHVDLVIDVAASGCCTDRQIVLVLVCHLFLLGAGGFLAACVR